MSHGWSLVEAVSLGREGKRRPQGHFAGPRQPPPPASPPVIKPLPVITVENLENTITRKKRNLFLVLLLERKGYF